MATPSLLQGPLQPPPEVFIAHLPSLPPGSVWAVGKSEAQTAVNSAAPTWVRPVTTRVMAATMTICPW